MITETGTCFEPYLEEIMKYMMIGNQMTSTQIKKRAQRDHFENEHLYRKVGDRFVKIPYIDERGEILRQCHDGHGHFGRDATWARLYQSYWCPQAYDDVKQYLQSCFECRIFDNAPAKDKVLRPFPVATIFERFALDYVGPLPTSICGNEHILVAVEYFTKWPIVKAVAKADQDTTAKFMYEEIYAQFGPPEEFLTDNGTSFDNVTIANFSAIMRIKNKFAAPYHP